MLRYLTVPVTAFQQNCSIGWCDGFPPAIRSSAAGE
jgi:hypothetical protein